MLIKRDGKDDCLIAGMAVGDLKEKEYNGKTFYEVGVSMDKDHVVNVAVWNRKPVQINKYDIVFAAGKFKVSKKDDKTYYSLTADFITKETSVKVEDCPPELTPMEEDDSLPF